MSKETLVIGGSIAGLQAALDLADAGLEVHLIESAPFFENEDGVNLPRHLLHARQLEISKHPNISIRTNARLTHVEGKANNFQVDLRQHPRYIDLSKCTACGDCIEACPVTLPGSGHKAIYLGGQPGCVAIDKVGKSPCAYTCPAGIHVQGYVALIAQKRNREAIDLIHEAMPFPSVCGRVCNHACEANCTRGQVDEPVNIMALKRYVADWEYAHWEEEKGSKKASGSSLGSSGKQVAIIGAGPAGLTAARDLNRLGHTVTVFDALPVAGGMMRVGIPAHRLPDELLDWEIQRILNEGIELHLNTRIDDISSLFDDGYDAVLIATGAHVAKKLSIPNVDHPNNWLSLDVLRRACLGESIDLFGKRIVVLGGGNVALDTARTVTRLGAEEVCMACLEPRGEMPGFEWEILVAEEEGIQMRPGRTFKEIVVEDEQIVGVRCVEVDFRGFKNGRPDMDEIADTEHILPADIVIWAIGQSADLSFLPEGGKVQARKPAGIKTDSEMMTSMPGAFVAGDVHRGVTFFVVDAIGEGHQAARGIDRYLRGEEVSAEPVLLDAVEYDEKEIKIKHSQASQEARTKIASIPVKERKHNFREVDLAITEEQAITEAQRCLICGPCSECLACVEVCKAGAISHDQQETSATLNVSAIIDMDRSANPDLAPLEEKPGFYRASPDDPLAASATAADVLARLGKQPRSFLMPVAPALKQDSDRIGAFICECGEHIAGIINVESMRKKLAALPDVAHTQILPFSCSPDAAETIRAAVDAHDLDRVVLAACSCCSIDQVCYSCTYQRLRTRQGLGVLPGSDGHFLGLSAVGFEFVNIREQCAWVHADEPEKATDKAIVLTTAAVSRVRGEARMMKNERPVERSVLILGGGGAAAVSKKLLKKQGISAERVRGMPTQVLRTNGRYLAVLGDQNWGGQALILAPRDAGQTERLLEAFGAESLRPQVQSAWGGLATHRPGVYLCNPALDSDLTGKAAAARAAAWLGRINVQNPGAAMVDLTRCRACGTCVEICEFGAPELVGETPQRAAQIDALICTACGTCAAHCPSGAISLAGVFGAQLETEISLMLAGGN